MYCGGHHPAGRLALGHLGPRSAAWCPGAHGKHCLPLCLSFSSVPFSGRAPPLDSQRELGTSATRTSPAGAGKSGIFGTSGGMGKTRRSRNYPDVNIVHTRRDLWDSSGEALAAAQPPPPETDFAAEPPPPSQVDLMTPSSVPSSLSQPAAHPWTAGRRPRLA